MKFSIVTLSFNQASFLEQAILSVLGQDYPAIEYIVVDPGSTDGSRSIIERYRDRMAHVIDTPDDGPADGLKKGFTIASGDIYAFLNADDVLLPGVLSRVAAEFQTSGAEMLMGHCWIIDAAGRPIRTSYTDRFEPRAYAYGGAIVCQPAAFFKAELYRRTNGFNPQNRVCWDAELFLDLLLATEKCLYLNERLAGFRLHGNAITGGRKMAQEIRQYQREQFKRIMGRDWRNTDWIHWLYYRVRKHLLQPKGIYEWVRSGSLADVSVATISRQSSFERFLEQSKNVLSPP